MLITASHLTASPGKSGQLRTLVTQMRDTLSAESGNTWLAWAALTGRPYGSFLLSSRFENYTDMLGSQMKLGMSAAWASLAGGAEGVLAEPAPMTLSEVIHVTGEPSEPKQFALVTRAIVDRNALTDALAWSIEVAEHATKVTGVSTVVGTSAAGTMFEVTWIAGVDTPEEVDKLNGLSADSDYLEMLAAAGTNQLFEQGKSERVLIGKLA